MSKIINVPIEDLEERYSAQWNRWFPEEFNHFGVDFTTVSSSKSLSKVIRRGQFLDIIGTNYVKARQSQKICELFEAGVIDDGDIFLFHDIWFPGLEMLFYMRDALGIDFKIAGYLHAGSYDPNDYLHQMNMDRWGAGLEVSWFNEVDFLFVATQFHKDLLSSTRAVESAIVIPFPLIWSDIEDVGTKIQKDNIVVFPHRLAKEKQPEVFDKAADILIKEYSDWQFIKTKDVWTTKDAYYKLLFRSKIAVSCALQETWGIAQQEALFAGCIPIVPDRLCYPELYKDIFRYKNSDELINKVCWAIDNYEEISKSLELGHNVSILLTRGCIGISRMLEEVGLIQR